jgi:hypothetical protein
MKILSIKIPLRIEFIDENHKATVQIKDVPPNFILPRVGETFNFEFDSRQNIVTCVDHDYAQNKIFVWYDYFMCFTNTTLEYSLSARLEDRIPQEKLTKE